MTPLVIPYTHPHRGCRYQPAINEEDGSQTRMYVICSYAGCVTYWNEKPKDSPVLAWPKWWAMFLAKKEIRSRKRRRSQYTEAACS